MLAAVANRRLPITATTSRARATSSVTLFARQCVTGQVDWSTVSLPGPFGCSSGGRSSSASSSSCSAATAGGSGSLRKHVVSQMVGRIARKKRERSLHGSDSMHVEVDVPGAGCSGCGSGFGSGSGLGSTGCDEASLFSCAAAGPNQGSASSSGTVGRPAGSAVYGGKKSVVGDGSIGPKHVTQ
eukprot:COSAG05_NODE_441_length_9805_cov_178.191119_1_plen_184_part_00